MVPDPLVIAHVTLFALPDKTFVNVGLVPMHIEKLGPTSTAAKLPILTIKDDDALLFPQGLYAVTVILLFPGTAPGPKTLTVI